MSSLYRSILNVQGLESLLLDTYSGASVAYSLRKLSSTYSGSAIRVRRSSDNTEQDIGFASNVLDTASLLSFVGSNDGYVTTWYDQSGNGLNVTQSTANLQPTIVSSGVVVTMNGKPAINNYSGNSINKSLLNTTFNGSSNHYSFTVLRHNATNQLLFNNNSGGYILASQTGTNVNINGGAGTVTYRKNGVDVNYANRGQVYTALTNQSLMRLTANTSLWTQFRIGYQVGGFNTYRLQEIIIFHSDQSSNELGIETNINDFYSIY
mgnify:CR=1 FL=1|tara:strand:- start:249 stop:1043 length:795 start_codon:yes stop_codon:yes gene_type:complete